MTTLPESTNYVNTKVINGDVRMLDCALWLARHGWHVFAVNVPIHDEAGNCVGCTCEHYKRSEEYHQQLIERGRGSDFDPNYKCGPQAGKCPAVRWREKSTTDEATIRKCWGHIWRAGDVQFIPNIGIDCGQSGLLVLDADRYKDKYNGADLLSGADEETVTALTGGGGAHLIYDRGGQPYGNDTKGLPYGIDIRGVGGYIVAAPSLHKTGRRYQWETGYGPHETPLKPIPDALRSILETAHNGKVARQAALVHVTFAAIDSEAPDLAQWNLLASAVEKIHKPAPKGARSEHDYAVVMSLLEAGAADTDILAVFSHYPVGLAGKFAERGADYLALTIGKCRAELAEQVAERRRTLATLEALRLWGQTHSFAEFIPADLRGHRATGELLPYQTDSTDTKVFDAVLCAMIETGAMTVTLGGKRLAKVAGLGSCNTALKALARLGAIFSVEPGAYGQVITLKEVCFAQIDPSFQVLQTCIGINLREANSETYSERKATDAFLTGASRQVKEIARDASIVAGGTFKEWLSTIEPGLGESMLRCLVHAPDGGATLDDIVEATGKTKGAVWRAMRRAEGLGLAVGHQEAPRKPKYYDIAPDVWRRIDDLAPTLRTFGLSAEREAKRLASAQQWAVQEQCAAITIGDKAAHDKIEGRLTRLGNQRLKVLGHLYPTMAPEGLAALAFDVQLPSAPHPALIAKMNRYRADARLAADAERKEHKARLASTALRMWANGTEKTDAAQQLMNAGYSPTEAWSASSHAYRNR